MIPSARLSPNRLWCSSTGLSRYCMQLCVTPFDAALAGRPPVLYTPKLWPSKPHWNSRTACLVVPGGVDPEASTLPPCRASRWLKASHQAKGYRRHPIVPTFTCRPAYCLLPKNLVGCEPVRRAAKFPPYMTSPRTMCIACRGRALGGRGQSQPHLIWSARGRFRESWQSSAL